ncbi:MAG: Ig-like domain-containing protein, partial [Paludibacter sp.]
MKKISKFTLLFFLFTCLGQISKADVIKVNNVSSASISATISGNASVCLNAAKPDITFTGSGGTAPYTFTYTINGGGELKVVSVVGSDKFTVDAPTNTPGIFEYKLTKVFDEKDTLVLNNTATVNVNALPTISGLLKVCINGGSIQLTGSLSPDATLPWKSSNTAIANISKTGLVTSVAVGSTTITYRNSNGCEITAEFVVNALPIVDFSFTNNNQCSGTNIQFTPTITGDYSYDWDFGDGDTSTDSNPTHVFNTVGSGNQIFTVSLKITDNSTSCQSTISKTVTVRKLPDAAFDISNNNVGGAYYDSSQKIFTNCFATITSPEFDFIAFNSSSTISTNSSYTIDWGDGSLLETLPKTFSSITHKYLSLGYFTIKLTAFNINCSFTKTYKLFNGNTPAGNLGNNGSTSDCVPFTLTWPVENAQDNTPGTTYTFHVNDGSADQLFTQANLPATISHTFTKSSCGLSPTTNKFTVSLNIVNPCDQSLTTSEVLATQKPIASFVSNPSANICANSIVSFTNTSIGSYGNNCKSTYNKFWSITPLTGWTLTSGALSNSSDIIKVNFTNPGSYIIKLKIQQQGSGSVSRCTTDSITQQICVESTPTPTFTLDKTDGCLPLIVTTTNTTNEATACLSPITYTWAVAYTVSNCGTTPGYTITNGTSATKSPIFNFSKSGTYKITLTATNLCGSNPPTTQTVIVKAPPTVTITQPIDYCGTATFTPKATVISCSANTPTYEWTFEGGTPSSLTTLDPGPITYSIPGTYTIKLVATASDCGSTEKTVSFTVNDLPTITGTLATCINSTSQLTGSATAATTTPWSSSNTVVATISSVGLVTAKTEGSTNITYKNSNGCQVIVSFTVNALPIITGTLNACIGSSSQLTGSATAANSNAWASSNQTVATVDNTGLITAKTVGTSTITYTNLNGCHINATFTVNSLPIISGILSACAGSFAQLTGSGTAATPLAWSSSNTTTATISNTGLVTAKAEGTSNITYTNSNGCQTTVQFTVNALPIITGTLSTCVGTTNQLTGSGIPALTNAWTSSNTTVASISNTGLLTAKVGGLTNITYTNSNGCQTTVSFTVNTTPTITGISNACIGSTSQLSGSATPAITNAWVSSNITVASVDNTGLITTKAVGNSTITYTNTNGCQISIDFTVNDLPTITGTLVACINSTSQLTGSATAATITPWSSSNTAVATINSLGLVTAKSEGSTNITYKNSNGCQVIVSFTVNALPIITGTLNACIGSSSQLTGSATAANSNAWASSNQTVATVDNTGLITAKTVGTSTITYTNLNGCHINATFTVNSLPIISGILSACAGSFAQLTGSGTAATPLAWSSSNTTTATISNTGLVTAKAEGTSNITYTNSNGCQTTVQFTVNALPIITGTLSTCVGTTNQLTGSGSPATPIAWISSNTSVATISNVGLVTAKVGGLTNITYTNSNGCQTMVSFTVNATPTITGILTSCIGDFQQLKGSETADAISPWNSSNTLVATIDMQGNVTPKSTGTTNITYTNSNGCNTTKTFTINPLPSIVTVQDTSICNGSTFSFKPRNGGGNIVPIGTTYSWELPTYSPSGAITGATPKSSQTSLNQTLTNTSNQVATATYTVTPKSGSCPGADFTVTVHVNPTAQVSQPNSETISNGANTTAINFSTTNIDGTTTYSWANNIVGNGLAASGTGDISSFKAANNTNAPVVATITVTPSYSNGGINCTGSIKTFTITVNPSAQVNQPTSQIVCNGNSTAAVNFSTNNTGGTTTYEWVNDIPIIGLAANGNGNITSFTATNTSNLPVVAKITVTPTYTNGSASLSGASKTFTITVNPTPTVDKPDDQSVCNGNKTSNIKFTGNIGTTIYNWENDKPSIGLASKGTGDINAFTTVNSGTTAITATIKVTPIVDGCTGTPQSFTITVNPSPAVSFSSTTQTVCSGTSTSLVTLSSTTPGATFSWTATAPVNIDGMVLSGTDKIPVQTLINKTSSPIVVKYIATAKVAGGVSGCDGAAYEYSITVNPTPNITTAQTETICSGTSFSIIPKDEFGNTVPNGTTYTWSAPASFPVGGITGGIAQLTAQTSISQTLTNTTNAPATLTYTITPLSGICGGSTFTLTVTVNPSPKIINQTSSICSGNTFVVTPANDANNIVPTITTYTWSEPVSLPLGAIKGGSVQTIGQSSISQTLTNTSNSAATLTYTVTPTSGDAGNCIGAPFTITVTVNPMPSITTQTVGICGGGVFTSSPTNGGGDIVPTGTTY